MTALPVASASAALATGDVTSRELVETAVHDANVWEPHIEALLARLDDVALRQADDADVELRAGRRRSPVHGVPIVVKDLIDVEGAPTTAGSRILAGNVASADSTVVARLRAAGAIVLAKSNTHEFGYGALTPPTRNPWDLERMPGGSSGGTAAAVAAGVVAAGLGTDSAGSVREPAALCGVVGLKPTFGRIPSTGIYQLSSTMSAVGPMARTVADCALLFDAMSSGREGAAGGQWSVRSADPSRLRGLRVGVVTDLADPIVPAVGAVLDELAASLTAAGATVRPTSVLDLELTNAAAFLTLGAEALSLHQTWLDERGEDYTPPVRAYLEMARHYSAADYVDAQRLRTRIVGAVDAAFTDFDVLLGPSQVTVAPRFDQDVVTFPGDRTLPRDFTLVRPLLPFSFTGHPAVSVPGWFVVGMPVGFQLIARHGDDVRLLELAQDVQALTPWPADDPRPRLPAQSSAD